MEDLIYIMTEAEQELAQLIWEHEPLRSGELVRLVKTLHLHRLELQQCGRKFHLADERMLRDAERVLFEELAYALSIPPESVGDYLRTHAQTTAVG